MEHHRKRDDRKGQGLRTEPIWGSCLAERALTPGVGDSSFSSRRETMIPQENTR